MVSSEPDICLPCNGSIEEPSSVIWAHELGVIDRIAMFLAEFVADLVLVKAVEDIDSHSHVEKPQPFFWLCKHLLLCVAIFVS
jgi:hypothetical protein